MSLSDFAIKKAKPRAKPYKLTDEKGLYVIIRPDGAKWWRLNFTLADHPRRTMSLGVYPDVELGDARTERDRIRKLVAAGVDPVKERKNVVSEDADRFKQVAERWIEANRASWGDRYCGILENRLEKHVYAAIGRKRIGSLEANDVLDLLQAIEAKGSIDLCRRMHSVVGRIFRFAIAEPQTAIKHDPSADIRDALKKRPKVKHRASIKPKDMGAFLVKLDEDSDEELDTVEALRFTILTAGRSVETRFADENEFDNLGTPSSLWRIPPERMKKGREHLVPLSSQADELVRRRIASLRSGKTLLFARDTISGTLSENTMLYAMYRLGYRGRATVHGFRGTFSTLANGATKFVGGEEIRMWDKDWIEWALSHVEDDEVRGAYNSAEYLPQRRRMLQWWADWLDEQLEMARLIG